MTTRKLLIRTGRSILLNTVGKEKLERLLIWAARGGNIDLLKLGYRSVGILNWEDFSVSGEQQVIDTARQQKVWPDNPVLFDVGANKGDYSRMLAEAFPRARIYAFEPNPNTYAVLKERLTGTAVHCVPAGLGSTAGNGTLHVYPDDLVTGHASRCAEIFTTYHRCAEPKAVPFVLNTVDAFCEQNGITRIDLLKIDTEGYELDVLKGARCMLERNRVGMIQFEFGECDFYTGVFLKDFYNALPGYRFYRLNSNKLMPLGAHTPFHEIFVFQNILAVQNAVPFHG